MLITLNDKLRRRVYIFSCEETGDTAVIDPFRDIKSIMSEIKKNNLNVKYIFNTHYHADHTYSNKRLKQLTGAEILIHTNDAGLLRQKINLMKIFLNKYRRSPVPDIIIEKDCDFILGKRKLKLIHTPGHTKGGICIYDIKENILFTGDTLFTHRHGRTDFKYGSKEEMLKSYDKIMNTFRDDTVIYPGHSYGDRHTITLGEIKADREYLPLSR